MSSMRRKVFLGLGAVAAYGIGTYAALVWTRKPKVSLGTCETCTSLFASTLASSSLANRRLLISVMYLKDFLFLRSALLEDSFITSHLTSWSSTSLSLRAHLLSFVIRFFRYLLKDFQFQKWLCFGGYSRRNEKESWPSLVAHLFFFSR